MSAPSEPGPRDVRALRRILRKLPAIAAGKTIDLSSVFGGKLHQRGEELWGNAWHESHDSTPPIKDIFRVSPGDLVDLRNYLGQVLRNADQGERMPDQTPDTHTCSIDIPSHSTQLPDRQIGGRIRLDSDAAVVQPTTDMLRIPRLRLPGSNKGAQVPIPPSQDWYGSSAAAPALPVHPRSQNTGDDSDSSYAELFDGP
jgi:hypothetical protein